MKISEMFPKRYATGDDLHGKTLTLTIASIRAEKMRPQAHAPEMEKWVLYFKEAKRGIVLNRTLAHQIAEILHSQETNDWIDKQITIFPQTINVGGKKVTTIKARAAVSGQNSDNKLPNSLLDG